MTRATAKRSSWLSLLSRSSIAVGMSCLLAGSVVAQTTTTFTYDALGRLTVAKQGSATSTEYSYDAADNRKAVTVNGGPTAVADSFSVIVTSLPYVGDFDVLANDADPNFPDEALTITGVTGFGSAKITIAGGGTYLHYSGNITGANLTYTIRDSRGLTSSSTAYIELIYCPGGVCP